jgi:hypothetical protein
MVIGNGIALLWLKSTANAKLCLIQQKHTKKFLHYSKNKALVFDFII